MVLPISSFTQPFILFQNLAPIYERLADAYAHASDKVVIAKVDADGEGRSLGQKYDVSGYPSMTPPHFAKSTLAQNDLISQH